MLEHIADFTERFGDIAAVILASLLSILGISVLFILSLIKLKIRVRELEKIDPVSDSDCTKQTQACHHIRDLHFGHTNEELSSLKSVIQRLENTVTANLVTMQSLQTKRYDDIIHQLLKIKGG